MNPFHLDASFWTATGVSLADAVFGLMVAFGVGHFTDAERTQIDATVVVVIPAVFSVWAALRTHERVALLRSRPKVEGN